MSQRYATLSLVRTAYRFPPTVAVAAALAVVAVPAANAAGPTATTAAPTITTQPVPTPTPTPGGGSAFSPLQGLGTNAATSPTQTVQKVKRPDDSGLGRSTLLLLSVVSLGLIAAVIALIVFEGRRSGSTRKRRQRLRSGRTPATAGAGAEGRRGPPPPPRKRRQQAKRKKR